MTKSMSKHAGTAVPCPREPALMISLTLNPLKFCCKVSSKDTL